MTLSQATTKRIQTFVDDFIRSEDVQAYHSEAISGDFHIGGRFGRCYDAAEHGCDGSTHAEVISDWRGAFSNWLDERTRGSFSWRKGERFGDAVRAYFDSVEAWHAANGSLDRY